MRTWCSAARLHGSGHQSSWRRSDTRHIRRARGPNQHSTVSPYTQRSPASHASARNNCKREKGNSDKITPLYYSLEIWQTCHTHDKSKDVVYTLNMNEQLLYCTTFYWYIYICFCPFWSLTAQFLSGFMRSLKSQKKQGNTKLRH